MKKIISLALTMSMLACMATTVFAGAEDATSVVGSRTTENIHTHVGHVGDETDGVASFDPSDATTKVDIKVTVGDIQNRYAVDVEYTDITMSVTGSSMVWDVNKLTYISTGAASMDDVSSNITIYNYSDKPVYVTPSIVGDDTEDGIIIACTVTGEQTLAKATPMVGTTPGSPTTMTMTLNVTAEDDDWDAVADYYAPLLAADDDGVITAGSLKIVIAKDPA